MRILDPNGHAPRTLPHRPGALLSALAAFMLAGWLVAGSATAQSKPPNRVIFESAAGVEVPRDFGCIHHTGLEVNWPRNGGQDLYFGPDPGFDAKINAVRIYGMGGLEWSTTEKSPGRFDWTHWDSAFAKFRRIGVKSVIYVPYNPPEFYNRYPHNYGGWRMQLPNSKEAFDRWITTITRRYPEINIIEVSNEVLAPTHKDGFWIGTTEELNTLADWILDWRKANGWKGKVWAPSIPGFLDNVKPYIAWLNQYKRTREFDAIPAHFYFVHAEHLATKSGKHNRWTAFVELRDALRANRIDLPIVDGERGFAAGEATAARIFNYAVKAVTEGIQQVCYFHWGSYGKDETDLGQPYKNPDVKKAFEDISALAGKRIVRVEQAPFESRWIVTTK